MHGGRSGPGCTAPVGFLAAAFAAVLTGCSGSLAAALAAKGSKPESAVVAASWMGTCPLGTGTFAGGGGTLAGAWGGRDCPFFPACLDPPFFFHHMFLGFLASLL